MEKIRRVIRDTSFPVIALAKFTKKNVLPINDVVCVKIIIILSERIDQRFSHLKKITLVKTNIFKHWQL
jgi:hypothetical protein